MLQTSSDFTINYKKKKLVLSSAQIIWHYLLVFVFIALLIFFNITIDSDSLILNIILIGIILLFYLRQRHLLSFKEYKVNCSEIQIRDAFIRSAKSMDWKVENMEGLFYAFDRNPIDFVNHSGDLIFVAKTDQGFLFNTIPDMRNRTSPFFRPLSKKNRQIFIKHLTDVVQLKKYNENFDFLKNEWTPKRTITRLFLYLFSIALIGFSCYFLINITPSNIQGIIAPIFGSAACIVYLIFDIKAIINNRRKE